MNFKILFGIALFTILLSSSIIFLSGTALAVPGIPHQFYGSVTINGQPAPGGATVTAKINGIEVGSTTVTDGKYGYTPNIFFVEDPNNDRTGSTIYFFANGVNTGQTAIFCNGCSDRLDLSVVTGGSPPGGGSPGGGGGGPRGGGTPTTTGEGAEIEGTEGTCREKWTCTEWSRCVDEKQSRECHEENNCGTETYRPFELQPCVEGEGEVRVIGEGADLFFIGAFLTSPAGIGSMLGIIVVILAGLFFWTKKKATKGPKEK